MRAAKAYDGDVASEQEYELNASSLSSKLKKGSSDLRFAIAVVAFAERLRQNPAAASWKLDTIEALAAAAAGDFEDRRALVAMIARAKELGLSQ